MENVFGLRALGKSEITVSPVGLGCWQFSKGKGVAAKIWPVLSPLEMQQIVDVSLRGGINWFDTAEIYGWGQSEEALADALRAAGRQSEDVVIATKWWPALRSARSIGRTIDERLARLKGFAIDLHQIHMPFALATVDAQMAAMAELVRRGKIRAVGVSNFSAQRMRAAHHALGRRGLTLVSNQVRYSLLDRRIEANGTLAAAKDLGITIIAYSPLEQGILSGKFHEDPGRIRRRPGYRKLLPSFSERALKKSARLIAALYELAEKYQVAPAQVALNWPIAFHGLGLVVIPGATKPSQAESNAKAMSFRLNPEELERLDALSWEVARH